MIKRAHTSLTDLLSPLSASMPLPVSLPPCPCLFLCLSPISYFFPSLLSLSLLRSSISMFMSLSVPPPSVPPPLSQWNHPVMAADTDEMNQSVNDISYGWLVFWQLVLLCCIVGLCIRWGGGDIQRLWWPGLCREEHRGWVTRRCVSQRLFVL